MPPDPWDPLEPVPFELVEAVPGDTVFVSDLDGNGLPELHAYLEEPDGVAQTDTLLWRLYEHYGSSLRARGEFRNGIPLGSGDLDGDGLVELASSGVPERDSQGRPTGFVSLGLEVSTVTLSDQLAGLEIRQEIAAGIVTRDTGWPTDLRQALFGDTDGDGRMEIVTASQLLIFERAVDGSLELSFADDDSDSPGSTYVPGGRFALGDFDGNGVEDIAAFTRIPIADPSALGLRVLAARGNNRYEAVYRTVIPSITLLFPAAGDVDGDGRPELLDGGVSGFGSCWHYSLYHVDEKGQWARVWSRSHHHSSDVVSVNSAMGDTDGDGDAEIAVSLGDVIEVYENAGDWNFRRILELPFDCPQICDGLVFFADLDRDGRDELVAVPRTHQADGSLMPEGTFIWRRLVP